LSLRSLQKISLLEEYQRIKNCHKEAVQIRAARLVIGPSVGRVFVKGATKKIWPVLRDMNLGDLSEIQTQKQYKKWFESKLKVLADKIKKTNPHNTKIYPGYKWGHATKIFCLFLNDMVVRRDYFDAMTAKRLIYFLYAPIDGIVIRRLTELGIRPGFSLIKEICNAKKFYAIQNILGEAAQKAKVPRIWFDDNWGDRSKQKLPGQVSG